MNALSEGPGWRELADVFNAARDSLDPMLAGGNGTWDPNAWAWR